jgi:hypothetical protein
MTVIDNAVPVIDNARCAQVRDVPQLRDCGRPRHQAFRNCSGSLAIFAAIRRASSRVSSLVQSRNRSRSGRQEQQIGASTDPIRWREIVDVEFEII